MDRRTNDKQTNETSENRRNTLILPALGVCWLAFLGYSELYGGGANVDFVAMTLGAGLMVAGTFRFLRTTDSVERTPEEQGR
ncbi:hypothetical protein SAMN05421858_4046 [Haladaptatus litoreus]|uniref:Uncharacterized protein n=1 Tax=Haladaptatus litoreus TaxID=553468 RepID=A0A1N7E5N1_9EURY|nr:hypothetical protein [Haladaptatus litoreus]SIR83423.1 hypothetical protein SAMN05421858_4046 [Haladaptatus litoreus]